MSAFSSQLQAIIFIQQLIINFVFYAQVYFQTTINLFEVPAVFIGFHKFASYIVQPLFIVGLIGYYIYHLKHKLYISQQYNKILLAMQIF